MNIDDYRELSRHFPICHLTLRHRGYINSNCFEIEQYAGVASDLDRFCVLGDIFDQKKSMRIVK